MIRVVGQFTILIEPIVLWEYSIPFSGITLYDLDPNPVTLSIIRQIQCLEFGAESADTFYDQSYLRKSTTKSREMSYCDVLF